MALSSALSWQASAQYFPPITGGTWDSTDANSLNWCTGKELDSLYSFLDYRNSKGFILLKDGKIVLEKYFDTFTKDSNWYWASAGKTLTAYAVGIAQEKNLFKISDKTSTYLGPGWTSCTPSQEDSITIWHQLTMTSGLDDAVADPDCEIDTCLIYKANAGTRWAYHNAPYHLLEDVVQNTSGLTYNAFLTQNIRSKIGMNGVYYNGVMFSTPRSMARFGLLLSAAGKWSNTIICSDTNYLNQLHQTSQNLNKSYGYLTWLNGKSSYMIPQSQFVLNGSLLPDAPNDTYAAIGKDGQIINVVPSQNIVLVRMGENPADGSLVTTNFNNDLWKYLNKVICSATAIKNELQPTNEDIFEIYPTLTDSKINIISHTHHQPELIEVINIWGNIVHQQKSDMQRIDVSNFNPGLYYIKISFAGKILVKKVMVK